MATNSGGSASKLRETAQNQKTFKKNTKKDPSSHEEPGLVGFWGVGLKNLQFVSALRTAEIGVASSMNHFQKICGEGG